ncbi:MAG: hypothetical protein IJB30_00235 [Clostridia bacterium]|nr:hypothetical protein [Clostridia bacterium]
MKHSFIKTAALAAALALLAAGCAEPLPQEPIDVTAPAETAALQQEQAPAIETAEGYSIISEEMLLPQDLPREQAVYRLSYQAPRFGNEASDDAVTVYLDELYTRVVSERMPYADPVDSLPYTSVSFEIQKAELPAGIYTNLIFTEEHSFGSDAEAERSRHVIVLGPDGGECSLASVSGAYYPGDMAAQQVLNVMAYEPQNYYGDLTPDALLSVLDLYNGFTVADEGYTLFIPAGAIAPEEQGMIEISFPRRALYPGFVGDVMEEGDYEQLLPLLSAAAAACGPDFTGFSGAPQGELAAAIVREYLAAKGVSAQTAPDYAAACAQAYKAIFGADSPGDILVVQGSVPFYGVQWEDAYAEGDAVTMTGQLMSGAPGSGSASPAASAEATVRKTPEGWILEAFEII